MKNETNNEVVRPLARDMARELTAEEIEQVGGACEGHPYSRSGCNPIATGDWDVHH